MIKNGEGIPEKDQNLFKEFQDISLEKVTGFTSVIRQLFDKALSMVLFDPNAGNLAAILNYGQARKLTFTIDETELETLIERQDYQTLAKLEASKAQIERVKEV